MSNYLKDLRFDTESLQLTLSNEQGDAELKIEFTHLRNFFFFHEGDYYQNLSEMKKAAVYVSGQLIRGVSEILSSSLLSEVDNGRFDDQGAKRYLVWTPDECIELVCYSPPKLVDMSKRS